MSTEFYRTDNPLAATCQVQGMLDFIDSDSESDCDSGTKNEDKANSAASSLGEAERLEVVFAEVCTLALQSILLHRKVKGGPLVVLYLQGSACCTEVRITNELARDITLISPSAFTGSCLPDQTEGSSLPHSDRSTWSL